MKLNLVKIAKQSDLTPDLALLTGKIAKQSNLILDLAYLTRKKAMQYSQKVHLGVVVQKITMNKSLLTYLHHHHQLKKLNIVLHIKLLVLCPFQHLLKD